VIRLTVVGDALLDRDWSGTVRRVSPDAPVPVVEGLAERCRPGGAGLAATLAAAQGADVRLVTALGTDGAADELRRLLAAAGVTVVDLGMDGPTPEKLRVRAADQSLVRVDRGCDPVVAPGPWTEDAQDAVAGADAVLVSDYGRGMAERALHHLAFLGAAGRRRVVVWDPHPRGPTPPPGLSAVTPNAAEAAAALGLPVPATFAELAGAADRLAGGWGSPVVVTAGERGAVAAAPPEPTVAVPATPAAGDPAGAGDAFAATLAAALGRGRALPGALTLAVAAAGRFVRGEGDIAPAARAGDPDHEPGTPDAEAVVARVRAAGGTVVAAGGCFDLLHPGHLRTLEAARALGDCLVVCLNSDASVRRLKGPGRPVNPAPDRQRLLLGLRCVDAVVTFDEDTPVAALERLRPDVFAKGGDYSGVEIPEAAALAAWGGRVVVLPLVAERSTTRIIERATDQRAASRSA
jgi:D-beta-D-heptose 7-phosphate kinase / D-beta-D-heptose 1-phosphate adenosyltransferase